MRAPDIQLLWWEGCPSTDKALGELRGALAELGLSDTPIRKHEVRSDEEADELGFRGSPTILIDGSDLVAAEPEAPTGLSCRIHRRRDGRISPTPDPEDLRSALRAAAERPAVAR
ncbi:MAG: hypothetical protein JO179_21745 [Solirubrobacterales bacterium]|nr:hypothetical protein [Solirubrobacterales bacterium]